MSLTIEMLYTNNCNSKPCSFQADFKNVKFLTHNDGKSIKLDMNLTINVSKTDYEDEDTN